ncbi:hypothetical protein [Tetragenococcus halophilus]|uniref:N-acetyltransferase domain-containing protein n=1 Tax=Tetragenococcus halophilus TaxID=51669 RepID=A0A3G5FI63_TETHA|nr:hypothetical protein [Tetragenococcus halophilus]AOF48464.1 hypothetical protein AC806_03100 [Tetragenococcus halophilus]AYW49971.1 hypothetical protein C7H83_05575 [Tetragenococcus halophilus]MCO7027456.1 hypothetical protein [Tetragenococcus halophilus]MCO8286023.1 hypothetical protein [Tetragenococcus halophilus]MCO8289058.1 hypothetical protein [Tetragenococcus halophilus]
MKKYFYNSFVYSDKIAAFDCDNKRLNDFFHNEAATLEEYGLGNTTLFLDDNKEKIQGFYTLSLKNLDIDYLKGYQNFKSFMGSRFGNELIQRFNTKSFPVLEIMCFGVAKEFQRQYVGAEMLGAIYQDVLDFRFHYTLPVNSIYIDALYEATEFYKDLGFEFVALSDKENNSLNFYPMMINLTKINDIIYNN